MFTRGIYHFNCIFLLASLTPWVLAEQRTWVDSTGKHRIEAEFVSLNDDVVTLRNPAGKLVKVPLDRLSGNDQTFAREAATGSSTPSLGSAPVGKPATAKPIARRFFIGLIDKDFEALKPIMSPNATTNWDATKTQLEELDVPDNRQAVLIRTAAIEDGMAVVNVTIKVRGKYLKQRLKMRWAEDQWRVAALVPQDEEEVVQFEPTEANGDVRLIAARQDAEDTVDEDEGEDEDEISDEDDDEAIEDRAAFQIPDGDATALLAFVDSLKGVRPPEGATRDEQLAFQRDLLMAVADATDRVIQSDPTDVQAATAVRTRLQVLGLLHRLTGDASFAATLEDYPNRLAELGHAQLAQHARSMVHTQAVAQARTLADAQQAIGAARSHLLGLQKLGRDEYVLIQTVAGLAERLDPELAAKIHNELADLLSKDPSMATMAQVMRGTARRLNLIGNPMPLTGITTQDQPFDLEQLKGKVVLVDFWATWCGPCLQEMPNVRKNFDKYHDRGFEVVAVSVDKDLTALNAFVEKETPPWIVLADEHEQNANKMGLYYGVSAIPTTVLVGRDGTVISFDCRGPRLEEHLERLIGSDDEG